MTRLHPTLFSNQYLQKHSNLKKKELFSLPIREGHLGTEEKELFSLPIREGHLGTEELTVKAPTEYEISKPIFKKERSPNQW